MLGLPHQMPWGKFYWVFQVLGAPGQLSYPLRRLIHEVVQWLAQDPFEASSVLFLAFY